MRAPLGDQAGCNARPVTASARLWPDATVTSLNPVAVPLRSVGVVNVFGAITISRPSGDQHGEYPALVKRVTDSPVADIRKMPPPSRSDRKAIRSPSGENAGCESCAGDSAESRCGVFDPTRSR